MKTMNVRFEVTLAERLLSDAIEDEQRWDAAVSDLDDREDDSNLERLEAAAEDARSALFATQGHIVDAVLASYRASNRLGRTRVAS